MVSPLMFPKVSEIKVFVGTLNKAHQLHPYFLGNNVRVLVFFSQKQRGKQIPVIDGSWTCWQCCAISFWLQGAQNITKPSDGVVGLFFFKVSLIQCCGNDYSLINCKLQRWMQLYAIMIYEISVHLLSYETLIMINHTSIYCIKRIY